MQDPDKEGEPAQEDGADTADVVDSDIMGSDSSEDGADTSVSCDTDADDGEPPRTKLELETGGGGADRPLGDGAQDCHRN